MMKSSKMSILIFQKSRKGDVCSHSIVWGAAFCYNISLSDPRTRRPWIWKVFYFRQPFTGIFSEK